MDDQGLRLQKWSGKFLRLSLDDPEAKWLRRIEGLRKVDFVWMLQALESGEAKLWRLPLPAQGVAVTYPEDGLLFIYYLHGRGLFGRLTKEDLLNAAREEGLTGVRAWVHNSRMKRILGRLGFSLVPGAAIGATAMELRDGRR